MNNNYIVSNKPHTRSRWLHHPHRWTQRRISIFSAIAFAIGFFFSATNLSAQHCNAPFNNINGFCCSFGVVSVNVNSGAINTSHAPITSGSNFIDYTYLSTTVAPNQTVPFSIGVNGGGNGNMVKMWIDWNDDGVFTDAAPEMVYFNQNAGTQTTANGSFTVPNGTKPCGKKMRVISDYQAYWGAPGPGPCQQLYYGTVEDYTIIVSGATGLDIVADKITAPTIMGAGNQTLSFKVSNQGGTAINSCTIGFKLNNGSAVVETYNFPSPLASCASTTVTFATKLNIPNAGSHTLQYWATAPNGTQPDSKPTNDSITAGICTGLNGNYTINKSGSGPNNYTSFTAAVNALKSCGVAGRVVFDVAADLYTEQIEIPALNGSSAANQVIFDGGTGNAATRIISFTASANNAKHTIRIAGGKYITFRNLTIQSLSTANGWPVHIKGGSAYVRFSNNMILNGGASATAVNTNVNPIVFSSDDVNYSISVGVNNIEIDSNQVSGGYFGIVFYGNGATECFDNKFRRNVITNAYYYSLFVTSQNNIVVQNNQITNRTGTGLTGGYGIYLSGIQSSGSYVTDISGNEVSNPIQYGMALYSINANSGRAKVTNNIVRGPFNAANSYGVYMSSCTNVDFWHNSVDLDFPTTGTDNGALYVNGGGGLDVRNNILSVSAASTAFPLFTWANYFSMLDYNNYYKVGSQPTLISFNNGASVFSKANLKGSISSSFNNNAISEVPNWVSKTNMRLSSQTLSAFGTGGLVTTDIDSRTRCTTYPSLGASESSYIVALNPKIIVADTLFINSPTGIYNTANPAEPKSHFWDIDGGKATFTTTNITYTFTDTGKHIIYLQSAGCNGTADYTKEVMVVVPTQVPTAAFMSESNTVDEGYPVRFTDLSTGGPTSWNWTVSPNTASFVPSATAQNPQIIFNAPGVYEVCLAASNDAGPGKKVCRNQYITVKEASSICVTRTVSRAPSAKIFDSGGKDGNYKDNENCSFLIDPCASSVTLSFASFNLSAGDYLRVYDGKDANATALHPGGGFSGNTLPASVTANSGKMFVQMVSNGSGNASGFEASWTSVAKSFNKPIATFKALDTLYTNANFTFVSTSTGVEPEISWDFNNDGVIDAYGATPTYKYTTPGTYIVKLTIKDCGGQDGAAKVVTVVNAASAPKADFVTSVKSISPAEVLSFFDRSSQAPTKWSWDITPKTFTYTASTDSTSQNPKVIFNQNGVYSVTLKADNAFGSGSVTKTAYIKVVEYCFPGAGFNSEIGINFVSFAGISNPSAIGPATYSNYAVTVPPAAVQKGSIYPLTVRRNGNHETMSRKVWIDYDGDGNFSTAELIASHNADTSKVWTVNVQIPMNVDEGTVRMRIGTSYANNKNQPCGMNVFGEFEDYSLTIYDNLVRPVITVLGPSKIQAELGRVKTYIDSGATAFDDLEGDVTAKIISTNNLNLNAPGQYFYRYNVTDLSGNSAEEGVREIVITPDTTAPVLTLAGTNPMVVVYGTMYNEPGASATDLVDGTIAQNKILITGGPVNPFVIGKYELTYSVTDVAGNLAQEKRVVIVGDTAAPEIILKGADTIYLPLGNTFSDPGAVVIDNFDNNLTYSVDHSVINNAKLGPYVLTYTAEDNSGNKAIPAKRTVIVTDITAPVLTLIGDTVVVDVFGTFVDPGYVATDNYDAIVNVGIQGSVNTSKVETYFLIYTATDNSGNTSELRVRIVKVVDRVKPVINVTGDRFMSICRWENFTDPGAVAADNYDATVDVIATGIVNTSVEGVYSITYTAKDLSGNRAADVTRIVKVLPPCRPAGIDRTELKTVSVYPNPSDGIVTVNAGRNGLSSLVVTITDVTGRVFTVPVSTNITDGLATLDFANAASGVYFITVIADNEVSTHKVKIVK